MSINLKPFALIEILLIVAAVLLAVSVVPKLLFIVGLFIICRFALFIPLKSFGLFTRFLLVLLIIVSLNTIVGFFGWIGNFKITPDLLLILYTVGVSGLLLFYKPSNDNEGVGTIVTKDEVLALTAMAVIVAVVISPLLPKHDGVTTTRVITYGGDNITHLEFMRTVGANQGYVQDDYKSLEGTLTAKLIPYPQGWHLNLATLNNAFGNAGITVVMDRFLNLYHLYSSIGLGLLTYFFILLTLSVGKFVGKMSNVGSYLSAFLLASILFTGVFFSFFAFGFQTQIVALALMLAELLLLIYMSNSKDRQQHKMLILLSLIISSGIAYIWLFLWPVALAAVVIFTIGNMKLNSIKALESQWKFLAGAALIAATGLGQVLFQFLFTPKNSNINERGFIVEPNNLLLLSLFLIVFTVVAYFYKKPGIKFFGQTTAVAGLFSLIILLFQLITTGEPRYFYYKSTYTFIILAAILFSTGLALIFSEVIREVATTRKRFLGISSVLVVAVLSFVWTLGSKEFDFYIQQKPYGLSQELSDTALTIVKNNPQDGHKVVAIGSCNRESDIKTMRLSTALGGHSSLEQQDVIEAQVKSPRREKTFAAIRDYIKKEGNIILLSTDYKLQKQLEKYLGSDAKKMRVIDLDAARTPKQKWVCPNYLS